MSGHLLIGAFGIIQLPSECEKAGWSLNEWIRITRATPSTVSLLVGGISTQKGLANKTRSLFLLGSVFLFLAGAMYFAYWVGGGVGAFFAGVAVRCSTQTRRMIHGLVRQNTPTDLHKPILYLRGFDNDKTLTKPINLLGITVEELILLTYTSGSRRIVALGKPGEDFPPLGAERFYVSHDDWQHVITGLITDSFGLVMFAAKTEATGWEIQEIFRRKSENRFLLLFAQQWEQLHLLSSSPGWKTASGFGKGAPWNYSRKCKSMDIEELTFSRLGSIDGVAKVDWRGAMKDEKLIGVAFDNDGKPILFTCKNRDESDLKEVVKWHLKQLGTIESNTPATPVTKDATRRKAVVWAIIHCVAVLFLLLLGFLTYLNFTYQPT
jgi:hypothetical protein